MASPTSGRPGRISPILVAIVVLAVLAASGCSISGPGTASSPGSVGTGAQQGGSGSGGSSTSSNSTSNGGSASASGGGTGSDVVSNPGGQLPTQADKPAPPLTTFDGCPAQGDGGDAQLNIRKNRTDSATWYPVSISSVLSLQWPKGIEQRPRSQWSPADAAEIARYEGLPIQVEGWLAGAKQQGPESCNCHSVNDVDYHLWIVDDPSKSRAQSIVVEVTPRVRAQHPGWSIERIRPLVDGQTKVRISGWLMMDQEHPDQVAKTRGTIWEIHPIIAIDVQRGNTWLSLDTGRVATTSTNSGSEAAPTEDPSLPPPEVENDQGNGVIPTTTAVPPRGSAAGTTSSIGPVQVDDIFYKGAKGTSQPDEYVEIVNTGSQAVNMDGWVLHDIYGGQDYTWHNFTIQPQQTIRVYTNEVHPETGGFSFGSSSAIWNNKGDAAELIDGTGKVVSTFAYGDKK